VSEGVKTKRILSEEEANRLAQEAEEQKKFIFLEKLKYEKAIKGYDRV
jgi:hypothetical protein